MNENKTERYKVPGLERGLLILSAFNREQKELGAPELASRLQLPRSTVYRLLMTLENLGFLERSHCGRKYCLALPVLRLGFEYLASLNLVQIGEQVLRRLSEKTASQCNLVVRDGRAAVYVARVAPPTPFVSSLSIGTRLPIHATVAGRVLAQDLSLEELQVLYSEKELEIHTDQTPKNLEQFLALINIDKERGYALGNAFFEKNISTVAAPVRDQSGLVVAALGVTVMQSEVIDGLNLDELAVSAKAAADELSLLLNYRGQ